MIAFLLSPAGRAIAAVVAFSAVLGGVWLHGRSTGNDAAQAACEARIGTAEREALRLAGEAAKQQRARAEALERSNQTLRSMADEILAENRDRCPLDPDTRRRIMSIQPAYPDSAGSSD